jgi:nucleoside-diphosphate-sugar epimerase
LHLIARGTPPESIRIIDFHRSPRSNLHQGKAAKVEFIHADITSIPSITAAFSQPSPASVSSLPLTVFHNNALPIRPGERAKVFLPRVSVVNIDGTRNVLDAAKKADDDVFIATSSASISVRPRQFLDPNVAQNTKGIHANLP